MTAIASYRQRRNLRHDGGPVSVIVFALGGATDGTGGADHMGCDDTTGAAIEVLRFVRQTRPAFLPCFEAELSECSMNGNRYAVLARVRRSRCWCAAASQQQRFGGLCDRARSGAQDGEPGT